MRTAAGLDLAVPSTSITMFADERALVVQRFDRARTSDGWLRVHQEDMCQALGLRPDDRYEVDGGPGVARIATLIRETATPAAGVSDVREFLRRRVQLARRRYGRAREELRVPARAGAVAPGAAVRPQLLPSLQRGREVTLAMMIGSLQRAPRRVTVARLGVGRPAGARGGRCAPRRPAGDGETPAGRGPGRCVHARRHRARQPTCQCLRRCRCSPIGEVPRPGRRPAGNPALTGRCGGRNDDLVT